MPRDNSRLYGTLDCRAHYDMALAEHGRHPHGPASPRTDEQAKAVEQPALCERKTQ